MEINSLYNGEIELAFDPVKHVYTVGSKKVPGATTVLKVIAKPALIAWSAKMTSQYVAETLKPGVALDEVEIEQLCKAAKGFHRVKADTAADIGHLAHKWCEEYMKGQDPAKPISKELRNITDAFLEFVKAHSIQPLEIEKKLYSKRLNVAGTADLIAIMDGELTVADYKSGSGIYSEHFIQMGAYDLLYSEEQDAVGNPIEVKKHVIVNCNKAGELWVGTSRKVQRNRDAFEAALNLHLALAEIEAERKSLISRVSA